MSTAYKQPSVVTESRASVNEARPTYKVVPQRPAIKENMHAWKELKEVRAESYTRSKGTLQAEKESGLAAITP